MKNHRCWTERGPWRPRLGLLCCLIVAAATASPPAGALIEKSENTPARIEQITSGLLETTRLQAAHRLEKLKVRSVPSLRSLLEEVSQTKIYLADQNATPPSHARGFEVSPDGRFVYVQTQTEPGASTLFYPPALLLSEEELVRLHIHEALHRALPPSLRQDEPLAEELTRVITGADATHESVLAKTNALVKKKMALSPANPSPEAPGTPAAATEAARIPAVTSGPTAAALNPTASSPPGSASVFRLPQSPARPGGETARLLYDYQLFENPARIEPVFARSLHRLESFFPTLTGNERLEMGLGFSYLETPERSTLGPLRMTLGYRLGTRNFSSLHLWATGTSYALAPKELRMRALARDTASLGLTLRGDSGRIYWENSLALTLPGQNEFQNESLSYRRRQGWLLDAQWAVGGSQRTFFLGARGDLLFSSGAEVEGPDGRTLHRVQSFHLVKLGPELGLNFRNFTWRLHAQRVIGGTSGFNLDDIADILGQGAGQGYVGSALAVRF